MSLRDLHLGKNMDLGFGSVLVVIFKQVDPKHYCGNYNP